MKEKIKRIFSRPILLLLSIVAILFVPSAIIAQPQGFSDLIIRALAIDQLDDQLEVSAMAYIPKATQTFEANYKVVSTKANSLYEAFDKLGKLTGRRAVLAHTNLILVNNKLCESGLVSTFDYLVRQYSLGNNTSVVAVEDSAKDALTVADKLILSSGIKLEEIAVFNEEKVLLEKANIESVYNGVLSPNKTCLLSSISIGEEGIDPSPNSSSSGSSSEGSTTGTSSSGTQENKKLSNEGNVIGLYDGKKVLSLTGKQIESLSFSRTARENGSLFIKNFSDENFENVNIGFISLNNIAKHEATFEDDNLVYKITCYPSLQIVELNADSELERLYSKPEKVGTPELINAIKENISSQLLDVLNLLKDNKLDVLEMYQKFNIRDTKKFQELLSSLDNPEDYISHIEIRVDVDPAVEE